MKMISIVVLALFALTSCRNRVSTDKQAAAEKPEGLSVSRWTDRTELFMEYPVLVAGATGRFAVHLTRLDNFKPLKDGVVNVELVSPDGTERFSTRGPSRPGIFGVDVKPSKAGTYAMTVEVRATGLSDKHDAGRVTVYRDEASASKQSGEQPKEETIAFLKEQQWWLDFATEVAAERTGRASFTVAAEVQTRAGGQADVTAPLDGRIANAATVPVGRAVTQGQVLARIAPPTSVPADLPALQLARTEADGALRFARRDRERAQRLVDAGAVPARRLEEALLHETTAEAA